MDFLLDNAVLITLVSSLVAMLASFREFFSSFFSAVLRLRQRPSNEEQFFTEKHEKNMMRLFEGEYSRKDLIERVVTQGRKKIKISKLLLASPHKLTFLVGAVGSGKTTTMSTLIYDISRIKGRRRKQIAIPIGYSEIETGNEAFKRSKTLASALNMGGRMAVICLDGIDDDIHKGVPESKASKIEKISQFASGLPSSSRLVISLNSEVWQAEGIKDLSNQIREKKLGTSKDSLALHRMFGDRKSLNIISLSDLEPKLVDRHFRKLGLAKSWGRYKSEALQSLSSRPFQLRLIQEVLQSSDLKDVAKNETSLIESAINFWLYRSFENTAINPAEVFGELTLATRNLTLDLDTPNAERLVAAGLLKKNATSGYRFFHGEIYSFFLSKQIFDEISVYDASSLSKVNLIFSSDVAKYLIERLISEKFQLDCQNLLIEAPREKYSSFVKETGWRQGIGHGSHATFKTRTGGDHVDTNLLTELPVPSIGAGTHRTLAFDRDVDSSDWDIGRYGGPTISTDAVTFLNWFDAMAFCQKTECQLPSKKHVALVQEFARSSGTLPQFCWSCDQFEDGEPFVTILDLRDKGEKTILSHRCHPDFRDPKIGLITVNQTRKM